MLVVQHDTQNFRQKKVANETRSNVCKYSAINRGQGSRSKTCGKILKGKFATILKKHTLQAVLLTIIFQDVIKGKVLMIIVLVNSSMFMVLTPIVDYF